MRMRKLFATVACTIIPFALGASGYAQGIFLPENGAPEPSAGAMGAINGEAAPSSDVGTAAATGNGAVYPFRISVDKDFAGPGYEDNGTQNNTRFIPPDPMGAAGKSRLVAVVNSIIEARTKEGVQIFQEGLRDFFADLAPASIPFDPKIIYDPHQGRFVVVALVQQTGPGSVSAGNVSRILLAVSKGENPATPTSADWNYFAIDSKLVIPRPATLFDHWADYPGFEVDEEAVYITANYFTFVPFGSFGGARVWIVPKGAGTGGFYDGGPGSAAVYNPYAGGGVATTTMPAEIRQAGGAGAGIGTYLVSYSGLSDGMDEFVQVVRVDDPLGTPTFTQEFLPFGDVENFVSFPDAPQADSAVLIETNDRRALDAVWQNNALWMVATITPFAGVDAGQTTAFWWQLDTSSVDDASAPAGLISINQFGGIGGEDIAPGTYTYFPSVAINRHGAAAFGFSASAPSIYAGAFVTGRGVNDPAGTVRSSETVAPGLAPYKRFFGGTRNRWGDYSGISLDPNNEKFYWVFNEYADTQGSPTNGSQGPEDGRWATRWARAKFLGSGNK